MKTMAAFMRFQARVIRARTDFERGAMTWLAFHEEKEEAYAALIEVAPDITHATNFWRIVQSTPVAVWWYTIQAEIARAARERKCADCGTPLEAGSRCEPCAQAKRDADQARRKAGRAVKRRVKSILKRQVKRKEIV